MFYEEVLKVLKARENVKPASNVSVRLRVKKRESEKLAIFFFANRK